MSAIRFVLTAAFMLVGLFVCCVGVYGVFKLKYAANRMHAAALNDTLGVSFCLVGLAISAPDGFTALKILLVVVFVVHLGEAYLADIALIYAMISFLSVVVLCKVYTGIYRERQHEKELLGARNDNPVETLVRDEKAGERQ